MQKTKKKKKIDFIILRILSAAKDWFILTFRSLSPYSRHVQVICPGCSAGRGVFRSPVAMHSHSKVTFFLLFVSGLVRVLLGQMRLLSAWLTASREGEGQLLQDSWPPVRVSRPLHRWCLRSTWGQLSSLQGCVLRKLGGGLFIRLIRLKL